MDVVHLLAKIFLKQLTGYVPIFPVGYLRPINLLRRMFWFFSVI